MSDPLAHYSFLPWLRRGIGTMISEADQLGNEPAGELTTERAEMEVGLTVESTSIADGTITPSSLTKTFKFLGPPDVLAISPNAIVRTEPKRGVNNYEANGLPYIEFYEEDFLWAYTPAGAVTEKLSPWLALICLKSDEFELKNTSDGRAYITINSDTMDDVFHSEKDHWAWAHVHLNTELTAVTTSGQITEVSSELESDPDSGVSRLLCPRKLIKETEYTAFLIPAFETGRLAGLGESYTGVFAQKMSWKIGDNYATKTRGTDFPAYYSWKFRTGLNGDFESLVRLLKAVVTDPELGKRDMYIANAGYGSESTIPESEVLGIEGALMPPGFASDAWTTDSGNAYREHLRKLLNLSIDNDNKVTDVFAADSLLDHPFYSGTPGDDPIVTPQIYGRWHALATRLQNDTSNYDWVNTLNLDPRNRAAAGLGTNVVKKNQEDLMRRAWKQVEQVNEANRKIRKAALARMINFAIHYKHVRPASTDQTVRLTSALHSFVRHDDVVNGTQSIQQVINQSVVPNASQAAAFKKITRPGKGQNKKINKEIQARIDAGSTGLSLIHQKVTENFNSDAIKAAPSKMAPLLAIGTTDIQTAINATITTFNSSDTATATEAVFQSLSQETDFSNLSQLARKTVLKSRISTSLTPNAQLLAKNLIDAITSSVDGGTTDSHKIRVNTPPFTAIFASTPSTSSVTAKVYNNIVIDIDTGGASGVISRATTLSDIQTFSDTLDQFKTYAESNTIDTTLQPLSSVAALKDTLTQKLNQKKLMVARVTGSIVLNVFNPTTRTYSQQALDELKPIMAAPKFEDPMFRDLKTISQEYILPNLSKVEQNSITLLKTNQAFIEAYMAGLNHEMSRELLWREYPTDQRGTYFRQFWDVVDNTDETDADKRLDIKTMTDWTADLGGHSPRQILNASGSYLVLLIRGELLKKYPNTQVYAQRAKFADSPAVGEPIRDLADETVAGNVQTPVFMAELDPDIYLFGFDLEEDQARGSETDPLNPGWFFVLRERPGQIRFGLDDWTPLGSDPEFPEEDPVNWNDLSWEHFVPDTTTLENYQLSATHTFSASAGEENTPAATWGKNAADVAYILYQNPVLFARHASEMLPPDEN